MQYRRFGNTGKEISVLGFGAMRLPGGNDKDGKFQLDHQEGIAMLHHAFEGGVNYVDTAPYYCDGQSEIVVGKALKGWRDKVYLATKNPIESDSGKDWMERLEKSLNKLDVEHIDFYHMWGIGWDTFVNRIDVKDGPLTMAYKAKEQGLIRHISFSFHDVPENMIKLIDTGVFESVLCQYNLLDQANEKAITHAYEKGVGVVVMGPVAGGRLGAPSKAIQSMIPGGVKSTAETAMRFVIGNPHVACALSGMSTMAMVEENLQIASRPTALTEQEKRHVLEAMEENKRLTELYCTGCNYCMPCPYDINIPLNFRIMNYHKVYNLTDYAKGEYAQIGQAGDKPGKRAEQCENCGVCETKCPQKIQIRKQLAETAAALGTNG